MGDAGGRAIEAARAWVGEKVVRLGFWVMGVETAPLTGKRLPVDEEFADEHDFLAPRVVLGETARQMVAGGVGAYAHNPVVPAPRPPRAGSLEDRLRIARAQGGG